MKNLIKFLKDWSDILILMPASLILLTVMYYGLHIIDPTAILFDISTYQIVAFNTFLALLVNGLSYFFYKLNFGDYFHEGWQIKNKAIHNLITNIILWLGTLLVTAFILLRNL